MIEILLALFMLPAALLVAWATSRAVKASRDLGRLYGEMR